ncbi:MAG: hypothetical protein Q8L49_11430 [Burkholderiaceae bacterium]|nr:hypothetical protein [Burkholderiaceae bacterium]
MTPTRRHVIALACAPALGFARPAGAALFGPDVLEVEVGSSSSGMLDSETTRSLNVQTQLVGVRTTRWVDRDGRVNADMGSLTQHLYENKYNWKTTVRGLTDIWQITAEDLKKPQRLVLRVRSQGVPLSVALFIGVSSPGSLDPEKGIEVPPSEDSASEWLGLFDFDPALKHFVTIQAREVARVPYRIAVLPAGRFRR